MDPSLRQWIAALHQAPYRWVLALTGGATGAVAQLLSVPGGSRSILEVVVPYHEQALADFLGYRPEQYCSAHASQEMARRALERARWLAPGQAVLGLGCTASLVTDRPKRGDHRFHVTVHTATGSTTYSLTLQKGARDREAEEAVLDAVVLQVMAEAVGMQGSRQLALLPGETLQCEASGTSDALALLLRGERTTLGIDVDGRQSEQAPPPRVVVPGAFNPIHEGHWQLAATASRLCGCPAVFELSVTNVDKPPLALEEVHQRLSQFAWRAGVWVTRAPTFADKATLFPGATFVVGADTAARIVLPRYYGDSGARLVEALEHIHRQGCRFLVAGREDPTGKFIGCDDLALPPAFRDLFTGIPRKEFDVPVSSTQLRQRAWAASLAREAAEQ